MKGLIDQQAPQDIFNVGLAFEYAMAELWRQENPGWRLSPGEVQYVGDQYGFPYVCTLDRRACRGKGRRVVEFKIARSLEEWGDPYLDGDCPADYALQVMAQVVFSGHHRPADLMVMGPFFRHHTYTISYDLGVARWMIDQCQVFYQSLGQSTPPELDNSVSTYETLREQHPDINTGERAEIPEALEQDWRMARADCRQIESTLRGLKSKVLATVGNAQYITCNGEVVAQRQPHARGGVSLVLKG